MYQFKITTGSCFIFQNFLTQINDSDDVEQIKRIHFNILTEIVQATTLCNVQEAKGVGSIESIDKTVHSQKERENSIDEQKDNVKRLQRYIGQLVHAKSLCDNRLRFLEKRRVIWHAEYDTGVRNRMVRSAIFDRY